MVKPTLETFVMTGYQRRLSPVPTTPLSWRAPGRSPDPEEGYGSRTKAGGSWDDQGPEFSTVDPSGPGTDLTSPVAVDGSPPPFLPPTVLGTGPRHGSRYGRWSGSQYPYREVLGEEVRSGVETNLLVRFLYKFTGFWVIRLDTWVEVPYCRTPPGTPEGRRFPQRPRSG